MKKYTRIFLVTLGTCLLLPSLGFTAYAQTNNNKDQTPMATGMIEEKEYLEENELTPELSVMPSASSEKDNDVSVQPIEIKEYKDILKDVGVFVDGFTVNSNSYLGSKTEYELRNETYLGEELVLYTTANENKLSRVSKNEYRAFPIICNNEVIAISYDVLTHENVAGGRI